MGTYKEITLGKLINGKNISVVINKNYSEEETRSFILKKKQELIDKGYIFK